MADDSDSAALFQQANAAWSKMHQDASAALGASKVETEQAGYQRTIDDQKRAAQPGLFTRLAVGAKDLVAHPIDDIVAAWNGVAQGAANMSATVDQLMGHIPGYDAAMNAITGTTADQFKKAMRDGGGIGSVDMTDVNKENTAAPLVQGLTQFLTGRVAFGAAGVVGTAANIGSMVTAFNPDSPHVTDMLAQVPGLSEKYKAALDTKPGDPEWENRLKSLGDALTFEVGGKLAGSFVSWVKGARAAKQIAEETKGSTQIEPTAVPKAPEAPPEPATTPASEAKPEAPPQPQPWVPETLKDLDTAHPEPTVEPEPPPTEDQPKPGAEPPAVFNPAKVARQLSVPKAQADEVLKAINEGRFNDVPNMLDDTHRTIPWDQLSDGANLKGVLNAVEANIGKTIKAAHGTGQVSAEAITQLAKDIGGDREALSRLYGDTTAEGGLAARITAGYNMLMASGKQLKALAGAARDLDPKSTAGQQALAAFQKQLNIHAAITGEVRQGSQEIGRALWAHRALKASTDVTLQNIGDYANTQLGTKALKDLASQVANADNLRALTNVNDAVSQRGWTSVLQEVAQNGMLSGPKTQITNAVGNFFNVGLKLAERYLAGSMGKVRGVLFDGADTASIREANAYAKGAGSGLSVAWKLAWAAIKDENYGAVLHEAAEKSGTDEAAKLAAAADKFGQVPRQALRMETPKGAAEGLLQAVNNLRKGQGSIYDFTYRQAINSLGTVIRWPGRLMGLFDHFSQAIGYHGDLNAQAYKQAAKEADAQGLEGEARDSFLDKRQQELFDKPLPNMDAHAMAAGRYTAFLEPPQTKFGKGIYDALNNTNPLLKLVVAPFIHRPGNILRQAVGDYTIAGLAQKNIRTALAAGGSDADLAMARMTIGTSMFLGGLGLAANGYIVGSRLGSKNTESLDAVPQYSIRFGDRWFKFDRLDPVGMWLGLAADAHEAYAHHYDPNDPDANDALQKASAAAVLALTHSTLDKSFMKSVQDIMAAASEKPERATELAQKLVSDNIAKLVPFSGLGRTIAQLVDPTMRASGRGSLFDGAVAEIPFLSQSLPPRRDLLGRPMPVVSAWNPFMATKGNTDQMDQELSKLGVSINAPTRSIDGYTLNSHEYDEVVNNATQSRIFPGGSNAEEYLRTLTASPMWKANQDAPDAGQLRNGMIVQKVLDAAYQYGRDKFKVDHPDLQQTKQAEQQARLKASIAPLMQFGQ